MKRILAIWIALVICLFAQNYAYAQTGDALSLMGAGGKWRVDAGGGFTPSCTENSDWLARATNVTSDTDKQNYDDLICGIVSDGDWSSITILNVWAAVDTTTALMNIRQNAYNGTANGTPTGFTAYRGYTGNSSSFYITTGYNAFSAGTGCVALSCSMGVFILSSRTTGQDWVAGGWNDGGGDSVTWFFALNTSNNAHWNVTSGNGAGNITTANTQAQGMWVSSRTDNTTVRLYLNSNTTAFGTSSVGATVLSSQNDFLWFALTPTFGRTGDEMAAGFVGSGLTAAAACRISNRINTYMAAYSINLYSNPSC